MNTATATAAQPWRTLHPAQAARLYIKRLRRRLTQDQMIMVVYKNTQHADTAEHEYCDANMVWMAVLGGESAWVSAEDDEAGNDALMSLIDKGWTIAKHIKYQDVPLFQLRDDPEVFTLPDLLHANSMDDELCAWMRGAQVGQVFFGGLATALERVA